MAAARLEAFRIGSVERPGWCASVDRIPLVGELVHCVEGEARVLRVLGRVSDGSRLLELGLTHRPTPPFFAASSNVLQSPEAPGG